jgi:hypothetical protein
MPKLYSEVLSGVLKILLISLVALASLSWLGTLAYSLNEAFYVNYVYSVDNFIQIFANVLYYIVLVLYLIWIYRVHMDLNRLFPLYPRSPGMALACNLIPFFSFYGIPSVYSQIGHAFQGQPSTSRAGSQIRGLAGPLIILLIASNLTNRLVGNQNDPTVAGLLVAGGLSILLYVVFLTLCVLVSRSVKIASQRSAYSPVPDQEAEEWADDRLGSKNGSPLQG